MKKCCEAELRKAAVAIAGMAPMPCYGKKKMEALTPFVSLIFSARDRILECIPSEKKRLAEEYRKKMEKRRRSRSLNDLRDL